MRGQLMSNEIIKELAKKYNKIEFKKIVLRR